MISCLLQVWSTVEEALEGAISVFTGRAYTYQRFTTHIPLFFPRFVIGGMITSYTTATISGLSERPVCMASEGVLREFAEPRCMI